MSEAKRFDQEQAAQMITAAGGGHFTRYVHSSADVYRQVLKENPDAVDIRVSLARTEDHKIISLIQAYDANGKPIGEALHGGRPCPPCCPKCPDDE